MNVGQKIEQMQSDLSKIVSIFNDAGHFRIASVTQGSLQQVAALSSRIKTGESEEVAKLEFKSA